MSTGNTVFRLIRRVISFELGLTASLNVYPHLTTGTGLRIRNGTGTDITVPWDSIETIGG